jgi:protein RecA
LPVDQSQREKIVAKIKADFGDAAVRMASEMPPIKRIPTGSSSLDWATGGGIALGRWSHLYGGYMSCKSLTCWNIIREAQALGLTCAYYNIENQLDSTWVARHGVDIDKLVVLEGSTIENIGLQMESLVKVINVHVLDSLAAAVSVDELNTDTAEWRPGISARAWGKIFRRVNERFDNQDNAIIMVNQVRDTFGYGGGEAPPGGRMIEFMSSCSLYFRKQGWLFRDDAGDLIADGSNVGVGGDTEPQGMEFAVKVNKSRICPPFRTARMRLDFETGQFDEIWTLAQAAVYFGVATKTSEKSSYYKLPDGETVQGQAKLRNRMREDEELRKTVRQALLAAA